MRKLLICALALGGFAASAQAADLNVGGMKDSGPASSLAGFRDPIPDNLTYMGVTLYGTIDIGGAYMTEGAPHSDSMYLRSPWLISKMSRQPTWDLTNNAFSQSAVGVKIQENLGEGWAVIGKLETNFNPLSLELADACKSLVDNTGKSVFNASMNSNGSRCGQPFAGAMYGGLSNATYGTLTGGRQTSLQTDTIASYDPIGANAFSLISFSGTTDGGIGTSEDGRWDNSLKYVYQYGPLHAAGMYAFGAQGTAIFGDAYSANVGGTYKGFSLDAVYTKQNETAAAKSLGAVTPGYDLGGTITNNESWSIQGKYVMELGGGFKDEGPSAKLTFSGGYVHIDLSNPDHLQNFYNGMQTAGWYRLGGMTTAVNAFGSDKVLETTFAGVKYETGPWTLAAAYYNYHQNDYTTNAASNNTCATGTPTSSGNIHTISQCAGDENVGSFVVDYKFDKHFDVYTGVSYSEINGGLAAGFAKDNNTTFASGLRIKF